MTEKTEPASSVLVVDDDRAVRTVLVASLLRAGLRAYEATNGDEALAMMEREPIDLVVTDLRMPGIDGMRLLSELTGRWSDVPVIMLTAHGTVPTAVEAMRNGAADFILKPFDRDEVLFAIRKALLTGHHVEERASAHADLPHGVVASAAMRDAVALMDRAAQSTATVLLRGESGTGKELAARAIHEKGPRRERPLVKLNCGALPEALLESELFGYEKGAFTGAACRKPGRVELADGGTLFLDEVGDISPGTQVKLLRVLQEREFERLGGTQTIRVDVRFVAATHRDLEALVASGEFREDLFYRLNVIPIRLPPLRERPEEIAALVAHFCAMSGAANGKKGVKLDAEAIAVLRAESWPGNVRQLQNFIERLIVLTDGETLGAADVRREIVRSSTGFGVPAPPPSQPTSSDRPSDVPVSSGTLGGRRREVEREALHAALDRAGGNRALAARILGVSRRTLYYKLADHGVR